MATLGDHQYPVATLDALKNGYATTVWDGLRAKDHPVPEHHEYDDPGAKSYFAFFGKPAWYAYDIGLGWRGYALNSLVPLANQLAWLRSDLAAHRGASVLATWADPRWSSGVKHGNDPAVQPLLDAFAGHSGVILNGHEHNYERFAPVAGLRQFVVGTGGSSSYPYGASVAGSQFRLTGVPASLCCGCFPPATTRDGSWTWPALPATAAAADQPRRARRPAARALQAVPQPASAQGDREHCARERRARSQAPGVPAQLSPQRSPYGRREAWRPGCRPSW